MGYSQESVAATSKGNLEISNSHLIVGKVQWYTHCLYIPFNTYPTVISPDKNKYMEKYRKYFLQISVFIYVCSALHTHTHTHAHVHTHTHTQHDTYLGNPRLRSSSGQVVPS